MSKAILEIFYMPELPHVAAFQRYVEATVIGRRVRHTHVRDARVLSGITPASLARRIAGRRLARCRRHGKHLAIALESVGARTAHLILHFGMTGGLEHFENATREPEHAVLTLDLDDGGHLSFTCKRKLCRAWLVDDFEKFIRDKDLGPDALSPKLTTRWFLDVMRDKRGSVKAALMDQSLIAGLGNEFADEVLFHLRLHPATPLRQLDDERRRRLWKTLRTVLHRGVERAAAEPANPPEGWLMSARRDDAPCPRCGTPVAHEQIAGRSTYYCRKCQPRFEDQDSGE
jgi:formamidopyrimidine-DNA glycosylase